MSNYYHHVRTEIEPLLPQSAGRIVDVGCGVGATAAWLKSRYPNALAIGLEGNENIQAELRRNVDVSHIVDLNGPLPDLGNPDLILCLDILEHLVRPEEAISALVTQLCPGGKMIVSLPNVAHLSVSLPLFALGRFEYKDAGILDRTHIRFFVRGSAIALLEGAGLCLEGGLLTGFDGGKTKCLNMLTFGLFRDRLAKQYILSGEKSNDRRRARINWGYV